MANRRVQIVDEKMRLSILFEDFHNFRRIWTHPRELRYYSDRCKQNDAKEKMLQKKKCQAKDDVEGSIKDDDDDDGNGEIDKVVDDEKKDSESSTSDSAPSSSKHPSVHSVHSDMNTKKSQSNQTEATAKDCKC